MSDFRVDPPIQAVIGGSRKRRAVYQPTPNCTTTQAQPNKPTSKTSKKMTEANVTNNYYGHEDHDHGHFHAACAHPSHHYVHPHPHQVEVTAKQYVQPVVTPPVDSVAMTRDILRIGNQQFDLSATILGSAEFQYKFIAWLTQVLSADRNVQFALSQVLAGEQNAQNAELKAQAEAVKIVAHALKCAYYKDGAIVFPGLKDECGKDASVLVPPVNGIAYDAMTSTLTIGLASVTFPLAKMVSSVISPALDAATVTLPAVKKADQITDFFVGTDDECHPAKMASAELVAESIVSKGIPALCQAKRLVDVLKPTSLLAFGANCMEFGQTSIANLLAMLNASLPLAPKGEFPIELRGFAGKNGADEHRYPVTIARKQVLKASGAVTVAGQSSAGLSSSKIVLTVPADDFYLLTASVSGSVKVDVDAVMNSGISDRRLAINGAGAVLLNQGDSVTFGTANMDLGHSSSAATVAYLKAGSLVEAYTFYAGSGMMAPGATPMGVSLTAVGLGLSSVTINE
jgi:hypothetical protein